jgi:hypothetical protein
MNFTEIVSDDVDWVLLDQDRVQWRDLLKTVMNFRIPKENGSFLTS